MNFLGIGPVEILVILAVVLIAFGPKRLPELAKHVAKAMKMFRDASNELQRQLDMNDWDMEPKSKSNTTSYTKSYDDSNSEDSSSTDYGYPDYDSDSEYASDALDESSSSEESSGGESNADEYSYANEGNADSSSGTQQETAQKAIEDPDKTDDAQRYSREMTD